MSFLGMNPTKESITHAFGLARDHPGILDGIDADHAATRLPTCSHPGLQPHAARPSSLGPATHTILLALVVKIQ